MPLGPPATRTEGYLAAILEELRAIRALLEDGGGREEPVAASTAVPSSTKRTRTRPRAS